MKKWELARYLIDAKKSVDSIMYIAKYLPDLQYVPIRSLIRLHQQSFYINCCVVLDNFCTQKMQKKALCNEDAIVERVYYERDKNYAHKDYEYTPPKFDDLSDLVEQMKIQIGHIRKVCSHLLPPALTLDFVAHDPHLFRMVNGITKNEEDEIRHTKYPQADKRHVEKGVEYPVFSDTEDLRAIDLSDRNKYAVIFSMGINSFESLQNQQDACVRVNVLHDLNMWCSLNWEKHKVIQDLEEAGLVDKFGFPRMPDMNNPAQREAVEALLKLELDEL